MKTLTEIKKVRCFNRLVLFVVALGLITTFTACSNDDDSDIPVYSLKDVDGNYSGTMLTESDPPVNPQTNSPKEEQPEGATVTAEVKDNQVMIKKLPVDDLIKSIVDEETAGIIIENLDDINYNIPYTAAFNDDSKGSILHPRNSDLAFRSRLKTGNETQQRGFTATGRTKYSDKLALFHV